MANIHILVIEELTDLLHELNDVHNLQRDINCEHGEHLHHRIMKTIFYTAFAIEYVSKSTDTPRDMNEMVHTVIKHVDPDGYVDRSDLEYAIDKALLHITRMNLAYQDELGRPSSSLLKTVQLCLTDTNYFIYGDNRNNVRFTQEPSIV